MSTVGAGRARNPFASFFMGGFECADHVNRAGERVNLLRETAHDERVREDYRLLRALGIATVREGLCWSEVEKRPGVYDFAEVRRRLEAAAEYGMQQVWDLCHFGYPDGLFPTHPLFCERFVAYCEAFAAFHAEACGEPLLAVPINEISFLAWHSGDMRGTVPFAINSGFDIKYHLCKAAIAGMERLRALRPDCRLLLVEPLIRVHAAPDSDATVVEAHNEAQFQAVDMIAGRMCPELGGHDDLLDILGVNYYWDCQWELHGRALAWPEEGRAMRHPLPALLEDVQRRYDRPLFLSETGHFGGGRARWLDEVVAQCRLARAAGVELLGACLYPVIDRPDWDDLGRYHQSGIWELDAHKNRRACPEYVEAIGRAVAEGEDLAPAPGSVPAAARAFFLQ